MLCCWNLGRFAKANRSDTNHATCWNLFISFRFLLFVTVPGKFPVPLHGASFLVRHRSSSGSTCPFFARQLFSFRPRASLALAPRFVPELPRYARELHRVVRRIEQAPLARRAARLPVSRGLTKSAVYRHCRSVIWLNLARSRALGQLVGARSLRVCCAPYPRFAARTVSHRPAARRHAACWRGVRDSKAAPIFSRLRTRRVRSTCARQP